ncbi:MAG: hypothetical protein ACLGSD_06625 [Acidobacteriota bacterium]
MPDEKPPQQSHAREPKGFTTYTSGPASEYAREQGWDTNEEQRAQRPAGKQPYDGGRDYDYGARDFGDTAEDTSSAQPHQDVRKAAEKLKKGS